MNYLTIASLQGYKICDGNVSEMTPLQKAAMNIITKNIVDWKSDNKAFAVL